MPHSPQNVALFGATGTAGAATARALVDAGHNVLAITRTPSQIAHVPSAAIDLCDPIALRRALETHKTQAVVSCIASRTGAPADAWRVDHDANVTLLTAAEHAGANHFVLLSAICVQKPLLAFQQAKLAFEARLTGSSLTHSIVRPTAFFKSVSGQFDRLKLGKPYLMFGDGTLTRCKPISDGDLGRFIASCLTDPDKHGAILPIGGPGPALSPRDMGAALFSALDITPSYRSVSPKLINAIANGLALGGALIPPLKTKAALARIGHYYATESMLVWDARKQSYDAQATPEFGTETLSDFYAQLARGEACLDRGDHAVF